MFSPWTLLFVILTYLVLLFTVAYFAERKELQGRSIVSNPYVYSLSLAVYCTSWTFYGSVGKAANSGLSFLTIYIGPTLMAALWWVVLRKIVLLSKENRITTISDFIASRYGKSLTLSALVTIVAVIGITPYLGLQLKAIMNSFSLLTGRPEGSHFAGWFTGWFLSLLLGVFAIMFGARRLDASERHGGLVFAVAFESAIKLVAFLLAGVFVTYGLFNGFGDIFSRIQEGPYASLLKIGPGSNVSYVEWMSLTFLSMMAVLFLPRQFHVAVVENYSADHIRKAIWLFPLYLLLMNVFVLPIAYGGLLLGDIPSQPDYFVLTIPLHYGQTLLTLIVFIGGFSAATAMIIVESVALSTMVMNSFVLPATWNIRGFRNFHNAMLNIKRAVILLCVLLGYIFAVYIGEFYSLVDIGLKSFEAVTIFAPSLLLGLYWKDGNRQGAMAGILVGFAVWIYTLLIPAFMRAGLIEHGGVLDGIFSSAMLNPVALFGLEGLDRWSHSLFWGLLLNLSFYVGVSLFTKQSDVETRQAFIFVDSYSPLPFPYSRPLDLTEIEATLAEYLGQREARDLLDSFLRRNGLDRKSLTRDALLRLRQEAERALSGALGPSISTLVFQDKVTLTHEETLQVSDSIRRISQSLRLSRQELAEANRQLAVLKEFSENIIESLPLGVATIDDSLRVRYWNKGMEAVTGVDKTDAMDMPAEDLFTCLEPRIFQGETVHEGEITCRREFEPALTLKGHVSKLTGAYKGYVLVLEDITEKQRIEEELFRATKHAGIGRLAAGVSHEVNNPLASISSLVQELLTEDLTPFARESLATINEHVHRIARIVRNLGDFARLYPRRKTPADLGAILETTLNLVRYDKNFRKIAVNTEVRETGPLKIDADQMQQVFLNLILNARDAMPDGGSLDIRIRRKDGGVEILFEDTGRGVAPEVRDRIFDPFFTTKSHAKGTGLGLSICYSIIKDHGGMIEYSAAEGGGSRFAITMPADA